jgi:hypothetical protein
VLWLLRPLGWLVDGGWWAKAKPPTTIQRHRQNSELLDKNKNSYFKTKVIIINLSKSKILFF